MDRIAILPWLFALIVGCATRVQVDLPPAPAVQIARDTVAVVAGDRLCRPYAQALLERLAAIEGIQVDPRSDLRAVVFTCGLTQEMTVDVTEAQSGRPASDSNTDVSHIGRVDGRAYAVVALSDQGGIVAHLLGTSRAGLAADLDRYARSDDPRAWAPLTRWASALPGMGRNLETRLVDAVATDLALQINPGAWSVSRRVFPNAPSGSARELLTRAVTAEAAGDLDLAYELALAAERERSSSRAARYVASLERQLGQRFAMRTTEVSSENPVP